jgi:dTDP-4-dehydrorhamnose 3,5-epimerase
MVEVRATALDGVLEIITPQYRDERGFFSESWNRETWRAAGIDLDFVQDNHSGSAAGTLRGLHYQLPPFAQGKLVRVTRGRIFDVAVDIRRSSASFGRWVGMELSAQRWNQLLVPAGFAHGYLALEDETEVQYRVTAPYHRASERAIRADDPELGIAWPLPVEKWLRSSKDRAAPFLADAELFA